MTTSRNVQKRIRDQGRQGATLSDTEVGELDNEIDNIVSNIRATENYCAAASCLNELGKLQELLSLLLFKYDASLSMKQKAVVCGFDRSDDPDLRQAIYKAAKEGRFP